MEISFSQISCRRHSLGCAYVCIAWIASMSRSQVVPVNFHYRLRAQGQPITSDLPSGNVSRYLRPWLSPLPRICLSSLFSP
ncbi:hypothetical protein BD309DRAFT_952236 [Dichomitus squalens]|uniref:Uncharacterized protein n=1 Tax=Dichomitus squalens TaxID=114155 RepID=A0A4Q9QA09_9APHY|nr:hypothetical protein BD309DRAFT_952236 [Dichomitus squalens]TBU64462.1 hypothetical protein BD310DRAFT_914704 [Dichomitus squalens]